MKQLPYKTIKELEANQDIQIIDGDRGKNYPKKEEFKSTGFCVFLNASNIKDDTFVFESIDFISEEKDNLLRKGKLSRNDIIITTRGTVGLVAYYGNNIQYDNIRINSGMIIIRVNRNVINPNYFYQLLKSKSLKKQYQLFASGCAQPQLPIQDFRLISIPVFSKIHQDKIAKILSNYDDLIENNNRRIKILEEMAQKIYKEWFVDFKFPGHETTTFKDSPLGKIPNDWEVKPIEKLLIHQIGGGWGNEIKTDKYNTPAYVIRGADIPNGRQGCIENCPLRYHTSSNLKTRTLNENDIVFEVSGGSKGQPVGRTLILNKNLFNQFKNNVICASFCKLLRVDQTQIIPEYIYLHLLNIYNNGEIEKYQTQSTGIINFKFNFFLENEKILIPEQNIISKFEKIIKPIFDEIFLLGNKNQVLKQTRDILLPRLISGEINVENMEIQ